jgi:ribosomal peptide maturation radical SAM protein 1
MENLARVQGILRTGDALLVVPPFALHDRPLLGVHILQAVAKRAGYSVQVLYTNLLFAAYFGVEIHRNLSNAGVMSLLGERLFARVAFGLPPLGQVHRMDYARCLNIEQSTLVSIESEVPAWVDLITDHIASSAPAVVGCSSSFEQNAASVALLGAIKAKSPQTITLMGGANCEGVMAEEVLRLSERIDYVFSGESESTFVDFLCDVRSGRLGERRVVRGKPCVNLDELPPLDYSDFFEQVQVASSGEADPSALRLAFETSRGCWWGQRKHCTFCGLNGEGMAYRSKSPERVVEELRLLVEAHDIHAFSMTDNIMPYTYFRSLLPRLASELPGLSIMYEQKANLTLQQVCDLVGAGIREIQPGIESLSSGLLALMAKGTTCRQNIALLRYATSVGLRLHWNLLVGFPNDRAEYYEETVELLPLIRHLQPPGGLPCPVVFDRFSPYFEEPSRFGIAGIRPFPQYYDVWPSTADVFKLAYHFEGEFSTAIAARRDLLERLIAEVAAWMEDSRSESPSVLSIERTVAGVFVMKDTRGVCGESVELEITAAQAKTALVCAPINNATRREYEWAMHHGCAVMRDGRFVPLATAGVQLLAEMEKACSSPSLQVIS